uniref:Uncharacterized protein n=1 Tax=Anguilla anguilla TaxID=7936 RepID=A0A0E9UGB4_ANGAN
MLFTATTPYVDEGSIPTIAASELQSPYLSYTLCLLPE